MRFISNIKHDGWDPPRKKLNWNVAISLLEPWKDWQDVGSARQYSREFHGISCDSKFKMWCLFTSIQIIPNDRTKIQNPCRLKVWNLQLLGLSAGRYEDVCISFLKKSFVDWQLGSHISKATTKSKIKANMHIYGNIQDMYVDVYRC